MRPSRIAAVSDAVPSFVPIRGHSWITAWRRPFAGSDANRRTFHAGDEGPGEEAAAFFALGHLNGAHFRRTHGVEGAVKTKPNRGSGFRF